MNALYEYISKQIVDHLTKRRAVVWYDSREEFRPYIRELRGGADVEGCKIEQVQIGDMTVNLCEFTGSFFEVKFAVEPLVSADDPQLLLVYVPGVERNRVESLLMELEKAGDCHEPQLKRQARNVLRQQYSDGQIDEMLASDTVTYEDIVGLLKAENGHKSMLKVIFESARDNADLIADWLAKPESNAILVEKSAEGVQQPEAGSHFPETLCFFSLFIVIFGLNSQNASCINLLLLLVICHPTPCNLTILILLII